MIEYGDAMRQIQDSWTPEQKAQYEAAGAEAELGLRMAEMVYQARTEAGLTQAQLAARMGVSQSHISALEGGGTVPTLATLTRIASAVGRRVDVELIPV
jgi:ribosome-binding protein aMBF1 (putative translation factor)